MKQGALRHVCRPRKRCLYSSNSYFCVNRHTGECQKRREGEPCGSSVLAAPVKELPCTPTKVRSFDELVGVEHEVHSDSVFTP